MIQKEIDCGFYLDRVINGDIFSLSRWGDGEWYSVLGLRRESAKNCDGHRYFRAMGVQLRRALVERPAYMIAIQRLAIHRMGTRIAKWLLNNSVDLTWHDADVFHKKSLRGEIEEVFHALQTAGSLIVVGPSHLRRLNRYLQYREFVEVPEKDCFLALDEIQQRILVAIANVRKPAVVSISAGMTANLIVHNLFQKVGDEAFLIDFGAVWDPYCGIKSRKYHHKLTIDQQQNTPTAVFGKE